MTILEWIGSVTVGVFTIGGGCLAGAIAGNLYGGIKGAYRFRAIKARAGGKRASHWLTIRVGLRAWTGMRYRDGFGTYWRVGGLIVPIDGRDKLSRERFWGA